MAQPGASDSLIDELMAGMGVSFVGVPDVGGETTTPETDEATADEVVTEDEEEQEATEEAEGEAEAEPDADADAETPKLGRYEQSVVAALESNPDFKPMAKRVAKAFELAVQRRELLAVKDGELAAKDEELKGLETRLQETAEKNTTAPAGPLAHLADEAALAAEVTKCVDFLDWVQNTEDAAAHYKDTATATAEEQLEASKRYALNVLKNQDAQRKVLKTREAVRAEVKKQRPTLFDTKHEDHKLLTDCYQSDPRTRADFDQIIADSIRGRAIREAAAKAAPVKSAPAATAPVKKVVSKADLPTSKEVSSLPVSRAGVSAHDVVTAKLKQGERIGFDEMSDAGFLGRAA
jgi:hypothetical protein